MMNTDQMIKDEIAWCNFRTAVNLVTWAKKRNVSFAPSDLGEIISGYADNPHAAFDAATKVSDAPNPNDRV